MSIKQYEYLVALAETGSFLKAAKRCCIGQPTLSIQIKKLEQTLGVTIFDRSRQPVKLTEIGQPVLAQVRVVLEHGNVLKSIANRRTRCVSKVSLTHNALKAVICRQRL